MSMRHYATLKVMKSGRITIPSDIREFEGIKNGDYVQITIEKISKLIDDDKRKNMDKNRNRTSQEKLNG